MRLRLAIYFILPCLCLAWPGLQFARAQGGPTILAPADPEATGVRRDAKTAAQAKAARDAAQPGDQKAAAGPDAAAAGAQAPAAGAAAGPKLDKYGDAHSIARLKHPIISWPKLLLLV